MSDPRDRTLADAEAHADPFGKAACRLMRRCLDLGGGEKNMRRAMAEEIENGEYDDPEWCRMVVNLHAEGEGIKFERTYRCARCKDRSTETYEDAARGLVVWVDKNGTARSRYCDCAAGVEIRAGHQRALQLDQARQRGRGRLRAVRDEDLPE